MEDERGYNYPWLAEKLNSVIDTDSVLEVQQTNLDDLVYKLLINGGVPFPTNCLLRRKNKIKEVRSALSKAANGRHWVVLHGMPGTGKSILAAEAIRDNDLINKCFKDGVFWVKLGEVDNNKLQMKMMRLYLKISESKKDSESESKHSSKFDNLDDLKDNLKKSVTPAMLLILDDLWWQFDNTLDWFDVGCPILVTTRSPGLFDNYTQYTSKIECKHDFTIDESKELLALYVKCDKEELPDSVDYICKKCAGSPFTLSNIGGWVAPFGNDINRWDGLKDLLEKGLKRSGRQREASDNEMKKIICLMVEQIENDDKDFFYDFVIFPEDISVPNQVFIILWDLSLLEVEDIMYRLSQNSLVQYEKDPVYSFLYNIHDLYLDVLKEKCLNISERHEKLVNKYIKLCKTEDGNYDFGLLPDDDYIHYYIGHHMHLAEKDSFVDEITFDDIFFDLKFIEKKLRKDPKDILYDYQTYKNKFKMSENLEIYRQFAAKHASDIFKNEHYDIVQLGLFEPQDSIIYSRARDIALRSKDKSYYNWCNQAENLSQMQNLNLKLQPFEDTKHAAISSDGLLVACVGNGKDAMIFSSCSGEILLILNGHIEAINYCMFNKNSTRLVTASKDKTVRIFELSIAYTNDMRPTKKRVSHPLITTEAPKTPDSSCLFAEHHAPVLCCCYSNDEDLIVSSDYNGVVHVWQSSSTYLKCTVHHVTIDGPVHNCSFNSDSSIFGTAAYDSIKLWYTNGGHLYKEFCLHDELCIKGFCFTLDNHIFSIADNKICNWDILSEGREYLKYTKNCVLTCCCLSRDGNYLACGTSENNVIVFLVSTGKLIQDFKGHKSYIVFVQFTNDSKKLLAVSVGGYFLYDMCFVKNISLISCEGNLSVRQNLKDLTIATSNCFQCIEVRKGITGELVQKTERDESDITACSLSIDCSEVVYGTKDGDVKVFSLQNGIITALPKHTDQINFITHLNNNIFFTCSEDKTVRIWNNKCSKIVKGHYKAVLMCVPFKQLPKLLTCSRDGTLKVWNIDTGDFILSTEGHGNHDVRCCDVSYDDKLLASASADGTVKLWNAENGTQMYQTLECKREVRCCRFSPSFQVLICGCDSGEVGRWILSKKLRYEKLAQQSSYVYDICFSKDGSQFLALSDEINIWKSQSNEPQTLHLPSSSMGVDPSSIWASDDFETLVTIVNSYLYILQKISPEDN